VTLPSHLIANGPLPTKVELARNPALLHIVKVDLDYRIAGEDKNKVCLFTEGATAFSKDPQGAVLTGSSSAGKSHVVNQSLAYFKKLGMVRDFTRVTSAAPDRSEENMSNKILLVQELTGIEAAQTKIRVWISEGKLHLWAAEFDKEEKKFKPRTLTTSGIPAFFTTTTSFEPDPELLNRLVILSMDETAPQTDRVLDFEADEYAGFIPVAEREPSPEVIEMFKERFDANKLRADRVVIPFTHDLKAIFVDKRVEARRDFRKLCRIIWAVAFLHQYQRPIATPRTEKEKYGEVKTIRRFVVALPVDFFMAWAIADESMRQTLLGLQGRAIQVLESIKELATVTAKDVAEAIDISQDVARKILQALEKRGYVTCDESSKPYHFSLRKKAKELELNRILDLQDLAARFNENGVKSWAEGKNADLDLGGMGDLPLNPFEAFVDPITGVVWGITPETTSEKYPLMTRKPAMEEKEAKSSRKPGKQLDSFQEGKTEENQ